MKDAVGVKDPRWSLALLSLSGSLVDSQNGVAVKELKDNSMPAVIRYGNGSDSQNFLASSKVPRKLDKALINLEFSIRNLKTKELINVLFTKLPQELHSQIPQLKRGVSQKCREF